MDFKKIRNLYILGIVAVVIILVSIIIISIKANSTSRKANVKLTEMAAQFYEYYYNENNADNNASKLLANFEDKGLNISLGNIEIYLNSKTEVQDYYRDLDKCDLDKTYVKFYPTKPYGPKDYKLEIYLDCKK